jgi:ABC-type uncharacterized transport system substrate-binding protein
MGPNLRELYRSLGRYVNRVPRGTKRSDLPVELPTKFELVINLETVKAIDLTIPHESSPWPTSLLNETVQCPGLFCRHVSDFD